MQQSPAMLGRSIVGMFVEVRDREQNYKKHEIDLRERFDMQSEGICDNIGAKAILSCLHGEVSVCDSEGDTSFQDTSPSEKLL